MAESMPSPDCDKYLTTYDVQQRGEVHFSGCLIYDLESEEAVKRFVANMSMINKYLIFFDPYKDVMWGCYEMDALSQIIEERCGGRVLLFLPQTDNFTNANMKFALQYAKQLDPDGRKRCLIPVRCYQDAFCPRLLRGLMEINMYRNTYSQEYWDQQSRQFRLSFSPNGPLRKECIRYNSSNNYHLDGRQDHQTSTQDGQINEDCSCGSTAYPQTKIGKTKQETEHQLVEGTAEDLISSQFKNDNSSISYQNTSLDSCQYSCKEGEKSPYSFAEDSIEGGKGTDEAASVKEADKQLQSKNALESQPYIKKDRRKKTFKKWFSSSKNKCYCIFAGRKRR